MKIKYHNIAGERFGRLVAMSRTCLKNDKSIWLCKCDCGKAIDVLLVSLYNGDQVSCGCLKSERARKQCKVNNCKRSTFEATCKECHKPFRPRIRGQKQVYCSTKCRQDVEIRRRNLFDAMRQIVRTRKGLLCVTQ